MADACVAFPPLLATKTPGGVGKKGACNRNMMGEVGRDVSLVGAWA